MTDTELRIRIDDAVNEKESPWSWLRWLTERPLGIALSVLALFAFFLQTGLIGGHGGLELSARASAAVLAGAGIADLLSSRLKSIVGRLKPHVRYVNSSPEILPALSFPSNHAVNSAFLFMLYLMLVPRDLRRGWLDLLLFGYFLAVGFSRVAFGQHYPMDVVFGWVLGGLLARIFAPYIRRFIESAPKRRKVFRGLPY
jgi:membrane-associated phospholipid phosphatase